jgi:hypothetical protein
MLAATNDGGATAGWIIYFILVWVIVGLPTYFIFKKAAANGDPPWAAFVPIYGTIILLKVVGRPIWWILLFLIPIVNLVIWIIVLNDLSKSFGKGVGFTIGLIFLLWIFLAILAWGSAEYRGPAAMTGAMLAAPPPPPPPA